MAGQQFLDKLINFCRSDTPSRRQWVRGINRGAFVAGLAAIPVAYLIEQRVPCDVVTLEGAQLPGGKIGPLGVKKSGPFGEALQCVEKLVPPPLIPTLQIVEQRGPRDTIPGAWEWMRDPLRDSETCVAAVGAVVRDRGGAASVMERCSRKCDPWTHPDWSALGR